VRRIVILHGDCHGRHPGSPDHSFAGKIVADSTKALSLKEASYPAVLYIPRADVDMSLLERTAHSTHCPYKGDASYYSINAGGKVAENAIWSYEQPKSDVGEIASYVAFYPNRVDSIDQSPA
jgi:uncharacterized protein (DUF427 family)